MSHISAATNVTQKTAHNTSDVIIEVPEEDDAASKTEAGSVVISLANDVTGSVLQQAPADDVPAVTFSGEKTPVANGHVPKSDDEGEKEKKKEKKEKKRKKKEEIADLDWWSKYYVTKEDLARASRERAKLEKKTRGDVMLHVNLLLIMITCTVVF